MYRGFAALVLLLTGIVAAGLFVARGPGVWTSGPRLFAAWPAIFTPGDLGRAKDAAENFRVEEAVALYTKMIEAGNLPGEALANAYLGRGNARYDYETAHGIRDGEVLLALRDFQSAQRVHPSRGAFGAEANALVTLGAYAQATAAYEKAGALEKPEPYWAMIGLARVQRIQGNHDAALRHLDELRRLIGRDDGMPINYHRGWVLRLAGRYGEAVAAFSNGVPYQPDYFAVYHQRACAHAAAGDFARAGEDIARAIKLDAEQPESAWRKTPAARAIAQDLAAEASRIQAFAAAGVITDADRARLCEESFDHGERRREVSPLLRAGP